VSAVKYERIVEEDLNLGTGTVDVSMPGGGTAVGHQIGPHTFAAESFTVSMDGGQSVIGGAAPATVALDDEEHDSVSWFNSTTYKFIPTVAGRYQFDAYLSMAAFTGTLTVGLYRNSDEAVAVDVVRAAAGAKVILAAMLTMNGGSDEMTLRVSHNDGTNSVIILAARLSGYLVGKIPV